MELSFRARVNTVEATEVRVQRQTQPQTVEAAEGEAVTLETAETAGPVG